MFVQDVSACRHLQLVELAHEAKMYQCSHAISLELAVHADLLVESLPRGEGPASRGANEEHRLLLFDPPSGLCAALGTVEVPRDSILVARSGVEREPWQDLLTRHPSSCLGDTRRREDFCHHSPGIAAHVSDELQGVAQLRDLHVHDERSAGQHVAVRGDVGVGPLHVVGLHGSLIGRRGIEHLGVALLLNSGRH